MSDINETLTDRDQKYGTFIGNAGIAQELKQVLYSSPNWDLLRADQAEALEIIASKIARMLNGDPNYIDNWHDIQGYARLVEERLVGEQKQTVEVNHTEDTCEWCGARDGRHFPPCPTVSVHTTKGKA